MTSSSEMRSNYRCILDCLPSQSWPNSLGRQSLYSEMEPHATAGVPAVSNHHRLIDYDTAANKLHDVIGLCVRSVSIRGLIWPLLTVGGPPVVLRWIEVCAPDAAWPTNCFGSNGRKSHNNCSFRSVWKANGCLMSLLLTSLWSIASSSSADGFVCALISFYGTSIVCLLQREYVRNC